MFWTTYLHLQIQLAELALSSCRLLYISRSSKTPCDIALLFCGTWKIKQNKKLWFRSIQAKGCSKYQNAEYHNLLCHLRLNKKCVCLQTALITRLPPYINILFTLPSTVMKQWTFVRRTACTWHERPELHSSEYRTCGLHPTSKVLILFLSLLSEKVPAAKGGAKAANCCHAFIGISTSMTWVEARQIDLQN